MPKIDQSTTIIETDRPRYSEPQQTFLMNLLQRNIVAHGFVGGGGAGKTFTLVQAAQELTVGIPRNRIIITRATAKDLKSTTFEEFMDTINQKLISRYLKQDFEVYVKAPFGTESKIEFCGMDDRQRWGSKKACQILCDEANEQDVRDYNFQKTRLRHPLDQTLDYSFSPFCFKVPVPKGHKLEGKRDFLWDCVRFIALIFNPPEKFDHWIRKWWLDSEVLGEHEARTVVRASSYDNLANLPEHYINVLHTLPEEEQRRMVHGEDSVGVPGDPAVKGFKEEEHTFDGPIPDYPFEVIRGFDPGYTHPCMYFLQIIHNVVWVWAECFGTKKFQEDFINDDVKPIEAIYHDDCDYKDYIDHQKANHHDEKSKLTTRQQLRQLFGYRMRSTYSTPDLRAKLIQRLIRENRLKVHKKNCPILIKALKGSWHRDDHGDLKKDGYFDNSADAFGYAVWGVFGKKGHQGKNLAVPEGEPYQERPKQGIDDLTRKFEDYNRKKRVSLRDHFSGRRKKKEGLF